MVLFNGDDSWREIRETKNVENCVLFGEGGEKGRLYAQTRNIRPKQSIESLESRSFLRESLDVAK